MPICTIIPPHLLHAIVDSPDVDDEVRECHRHTLQNTAHIRGIRANRTNALRSTQNGTGGPHVHHHGFIPPQMQQALADSEHEEAAFSTQTTDNQAVDQRIREARASAVKSAPKPTDESGLRRTIYDAEHSFQESSLPGDVVLLKEGDAPIPLSKDPSNDANECYENFKHTYDFYRQFFNRNSLDDKGRKLIGSVHFGVKYQNAFWDGNQMVFGDGDQKIFTQFTGIRDVVGHELTHGVVQYTCNLDYENQPGALNESLADVFGIMVRQWSENQTPENARWVIGEGILAKGINGRGLRDMKAPGTAYDDRRLGKDPQPGHMDDYKNLRNTASGDYGGVHINSGIPNHAFYLAAVKIGGNSWESAGPIWYKTMTDSALKSNATFQQFAQITVNNAGEHVDKVIEAWKEVGITVSKGNTEEDPAKDPEKAPEDGPKDGPKGDTEEPNPKQDNEL